MRPDTLNSSKIKSYEPEILITERFFRKKQAPKPKPSSKTDYAAWIETKYIL